MDTVYTDPLHILVVEDNYGDYFLLKEEIASLDIPVDGLVNATSLANAIDYLHTNKPDIILLDLFLPDSNGIETYRKLKAHLNSSAVIVLSGLSDKKSALEAIKSGAQDYLTKGEFDRNLLEKSIMYAIERMKNLERLQMANHRFNLVSRATHDLIWDWDLRTGMIQYDEQNAREVFGSFGKKLMDINEWLTLVHPDDVIRIYALLAHIKMSPGDVFDVQYRLKGCDGEYKFIYDRGHVLRDVNGKVIRLIGAAQDITENIRMEKEIAETRRRETQAVEAAIIRGQEEERKRIGLEIHDNITQILATARLYLDNVTNSNQSELLDRSRNMISLASGELRKLSHQLLPPTPEFGLKQAMEDLTNRLSNNGVIEFEIKCDDFQEDLLTEDQQLTIYRILQEQVNNTIKHAQATKAMISLLMPEDGEQIQLLVKDNGKGFDLSEKKKGVGLRNIISRTRTYGGFVNVQTQPGSGCELKVVFPTSKSSPSFKHTESATVVMERV
jgi:Signal transduction histidine kinase